MMVRREHLLVLLPALACVAGIPLMNRDGQVQEAFLRQELQDAFTTGRAGPGLRQVVQELDLEKLMNEEAEHPEPQISLLCMTCHLGVNMILDAVQNSTDPTAVADMMISLCVDLGVANQIVCENFVRLAEDQLFWVVKNREGLTGNDVCGMMFGGMGCETDNPDRVWAVQLPDVPKPPVTLPDPPQPGAPVMKVLHLADTHYDPGYLPGSNAECPENYHCCRAESGPVETPEAAAGKWGDYRYCDAPKWLLEEVYSHVNKEFPDLDFIIWTGDLVPHNIWNTSQQSNLEIVSASVQMVKDFFPGVPVFPALGNHEAHPVNAIPQPYIEGEFDISWLYDEVALLWELWLPGEAAISVAYSGYYSVLAKPGLRILSINSNYCYGYNWWLVYDDVDPGSGLQWMAQELQKAEDAGEKVYLISHHHPGHADCTKSWSHQYNRIVVRYESTIAGMFYGHTHKDHFMMMYDPEDKTRAVQVGYVGQSQTPYNRLNPGYKVYTVDGDYEGSSYQVLDHANYIMDLDEANANDEVRFFLHYTAREAYGLADLSPASWSALVDELAAPNSTLFDTFFEHYVKNGRPRMEEGCDDDCKAEVLCRLVVSDTTDYSGCDRF